MVGSRTNIKINLITLITMSLTDHTTAALVTEFMSNESVPFYVCPWTIVAQESLTGLLDTIHGLHKRS